jgi:hypothetical protein
MTGSNLLNGELYNWLMTPPGTDSFVLRDLDAACEADLEWVENGMHLTLVEVEGGNGRQAYPLTWCTHGATRTARSGAPPHGSRISRRGAG